MVLFGIGLLAGSVALVTATATVDVLRSQMSGGNQGSPPYNALRWMYYISGIIGMVAGIWFIVGATG